MIPWSYKQLSEKDARDLVDYLFAPGKRWVDAKKAAADAGGTQGVAERPHWKPGAKWARQRATDGHPKPYKIPIIVQFGNEERLRHNYVKGFRKIMGAIWQQLKKVAPEKTRDGSVRFMCTGPS